MKAEMNSVIKKEILPWVILFVPSGLSKSHPPGSRIQPQSSRALDVLDFHGHYTPPPCGFPWHLVYTPN